MKLVPYYKCPATVHPTYGDLQWVAGFLEGEGTFGLTGGSTRARTQRLSCRQVQQWPLLKLSAFFGGRVTLIHQQSNKWSNKPIWDWTLTGTRARGLMMTIYGLMSPERQIKMRTALAWSLVIREPGLKRRRRNTHISEKAG
jgi:hypothetical protein